MAAPQNYTSLDDVEALTVGHTIHNVGDTWVNFFASTNQHPVTAGNLYRYSVAGSAGRFEQVGMGWLHHGFFALSQSSGCTCIPTDGQHLGVGCSDVSTSARVGGQVGLGPRWQVNAHTGAFPYPPASPPFSGSVARRIQVATSDLEPTGGTTRYFHESHFVTPDDATAGNGDNNTSYRELAVSGSASAWTFGITGSVVSEKSAIRAWKAIDPGVTEVDLRIPGEGLLVLGYRVTPLGGGQWHYEYALYNMNSDASVGSFSLALGAGVTLSNIGFHDVAYHDGDGPGNVNFSGTDWTPTHSSGAITWATESFATNPSANALRWGTTYNFRFDANMPPETGTLTLELFKSAGYVQAEVLVPSSTGPVGPGLAFCAGDTSLSTACPCALPNVVPNPTAAAGHGCANSFDLNGARLKLTGTLSPDTVTFTTLIGGNSAAFGLLLRGNASDANGVANGDGVRCVDGQLFRFGGHNAGTNGAPLGTWTYPNSAQTVPVSIATLQSPGQAAYYQLFYRNLAASFCSPATTNMSNGVQINWP
jgi:hypothetical protein